MVRIVRCRPRESARIGLRRGNIVATPRVTVVRRPYQRPHILDAIARWPSPDPTCTTVGFAMKRRKNNLSQVLAGQKVGVRQVSDEIWIVSFMHYDLGYFDNNTCRLEPIENPFGAKVLPMRPAGMICYPCVMPSGFATLDDQPGCP
jgi:hypothetical protein